jgi:hypothetical protein
MTNMRANLGTARQFLARLIALAVILAAMATSAMAVQHAASAAHATAAAPADIHHAGETAAHGGCPPSESGESFCCGHAACASGWSLGPSPYFPALLAGAKKFGGPAQPGVASARNFPTLEPPKP